jgi:hypothetical protein
MRIVLFGIGLAASALCPGGALFAGPAAAFSDHLFAVTTNGANAGNCASLELNSPWTATTNLEPTSARPSVRHFAGLHYVVNGSPAHDLQIIDPETFETIRKIQFASAPDPQDVLVLGDGTAYVSFFDSADLLRVDLATGATIDAVDLSSFADSDGLPEQSHMARDGNHAFVQLQRIDRSIDPGPQLDGLLAVIDITTNELVDADAAAPGTQAIQLAWSIPRLPMQIEGRRLYVGEPGGFYDQMGGIEAIDLDTLEPSGLIYVEKTMGAAAMSGFLFVSPTRGYFIHHTDFAQSSHLVSFSRQTGQFLAEHFVTFGLTERIAHDVETGLLFFPDSDFGVDGIRVFDAATGEQLTSAPISTGLGPVDVVVARDPGGVGAPSLPLDGFHAWAIPNPSRGALSIHWRGESENDISLSIVDARGRLVRKWDRVVSDSISWDAHDDADRPVAPGVYFLRLDSTHERTGSFVIVR